MQTSHPASLRRVLAITLALLAIGGLAPAAAQAPAETIVARFDGTTATTVQTLGGTERKQSFEFELPDGAQQRLTLTLNWEDAPATNLQLELFDAAGVRRGAALSSNAVEQIVTLEQPGAGRYRAVITEIRTTAGTGFHLVAYARRAPGATPTACEAAYAGLDAEGRPVRVDPQIRYGAAGALILTFNSDAARDLGAALLRATDGLDDAVRASVRAYERLPIVTLAAAAVTPQLVQHVAQRLAPARLLGIYANRPLALALDTSTGVIGVPQARAHYGVTGRGIGVAVIDTGIDTTHGDFDNVALNVKVTVAGPAIAVANSDTTTGHGTHVASTVGGTGAVSGGRFTGVAPGATLLGLGAGDGLHIIAVLDAWNYLLDPDVYLTHNVRVTNNSYGSGPGDFDPGSPIDVATKRAYDKGMISVFAAGNDGDVGDGYDTVNQESISPCVISVAAGQRDGTLARFSSRGVAGDPIKHPDITAPGVEIAAARAATGFVVTAAYPKFPDNDPRYVILNGTSMASPHIAGVVALLLESDPTLSFERVLEALQATARPMFDAAGRRYAPHEVGAGYADTLAAIAWTRGEPPPVVDNGPGPGTTVIDRFTGTSGLSFAVAGVSVQSSDFVRQVEVPALADLQEVRVQLAWPAAGGELELTVVAPDGTSRTAPAAASDPAGDAVREVVFAGAPRGGTYTVRVRPKTYLGTQFRGSVAIRRPE